MALPTVRRRRILLSGGAAIATLLAGCSGDNSVDEIESNMEAAMEDLEAVDPQLESVATAIDEEDWDGVLDLVEDIRADVESARGSLTDARDLAEENDHQDHLAAINRLLEYADIVEAMADELEALVADGRAGDGEALQGHWETVQELDDDRHAKREEIDAALDDL